MKLTRSLAAAALLAGAIVVLSGTTASAAPTRYEAETAPATCDGTIDSNHAGFSGSGFCNGRNATGAAAQFTVTASAAGTATLGVRFANGTTTARPASLVVNGATISTVSFEGTGAWTTWVTKTLTVSVNSGSNTVRLSPTTANGLANVDFLDFEVAGNPPGNAMAIVAAMQPGWNLGNSLDSTGSDETSWGNPRITQALINNVRAQGFKSIRIPVTWGHHQGAAPNYTIEAAYLNRVKEVVDWALAADLYVVVNIHHDSWEWVNTMPTNGAVVRARYNAIWTQVASVFRNSSSKLVFESLNEPQFTGSSGDAQNAALLHELNTSFRQIVRQSGGNNTTRLLVLPTLHTSADLARVNELVTTFNSLNDPNLVATVHFYGFWPFSVNVAGYTRFNAEVQQDLTSSFDRVYNAFVTRNIPVIIGEYGLLGFDRHTGTIEQGEKLKFFEYLGFWARTRQITTMLWDNGQHFGRTSFQWSDPELIAQIRSSWTTRSGTASTDQVFNLRSSAITSKTVTLNLNGTSFLGVRQGTTDLAPGSDYTVSGSQLTFTASALTRLSGNRAYGVNATVQVRFSQGVPWRINIMTYDPPTQQNASGSTSSFAIPTTFRGDTLATMEAKYSDGSNAGPHNWTSFKEFDVAFAPNYGGSTISLTTAFFNEVNNGARVTLTFHFWSGTRVTYFVTKNGSSVTGSTT
jgi:aryl-phospho-beta-D-glucosidase BglC (GH1 family)